MAVAYDNDAEATGEFVSTLATPSFTIGSGSDRAIVAGVGERSTTLSSVSGAGATWAAVSGASVAGPTSLAMAQWAGIAPNTGSQTVTATFADSNGESLLISAVSFTGADQTTPAQNGTSATGSSTAITVTVASAAADDFIIDIAQGTDGVTAEGAGQTVRALGGGGNTSTQDGADGGVMSWTAATSGTWGTAACRVVAAGAAATLVKDLIAMGLIPFARS